MEQNEKTTRFVAELDRFSGGRLVNKEDFGTLLHLSSESELDSTFDRLAFLAKFSVKSRKIMNRIGRDGEGYEALSAELSNSINEITGLIRKIAANAPPGERQRIEERYMTMTGSGLRNLFSLLDDLAWYKNWTIDHGPREP